MPLGPLTYDASQELTADTNNIPASFGYRVDVTGTLRARLRGDATTRDWPVVGGIDYAGSIAQVVFSAGTVNVTKVWILRQSGKV